MYTYIRRITLAGVITGLLIGAGVTYITLVYLKQCMPCAMGNTGVMKKCALKEALRKLWSDHVIWTRNYIQAALIHDPSVQEVTTRLLKNQDDLGNAIVPFYGKEAGAKLADLLKQHILISAEIVKAAEAKNNKKVEEEQKKWHDNAREIAHFLSSANKFWPEHDLTMMLFDHLDLTTQEATNRIAKKWHDEVAIFDKIFDQALSMADALADGIIKQFPDKFK